MLPVIITVCILSFIFIELGFKIFRRFKLRGLVILASIVFVILYGYSYFFEASEFGRENRLFSLLLVNAIVLSLPLVIMSLTVVFSSTVSQKSSHIIAVVLSIVWGLVFPFFALITACSVGSDCI